MLLLPKKLVEIEDLKHLVVIFFTKLAEILLCYCVFVSHLFVGLVHHETLSFCFKQWIKPHCDMDSSPKSIFLMRNMIVWMSNTNFGVSSFFTSWCYARVVSDQTPYPQHTLICFFFSASESVYNSV